MMTRHFIHHDSRNLYFDNHDKIDDIRNMDEDNRNLYDDKPIKNDDKRHFV